MILIVDDVPETLMLIEHMLAAGGLGPVVTAASAEQAYALLEVDRHDGAAASVNAILMDIQLPGDDGIDAICTIKANPRLAPIPIIVVSACEDEESLVNGFLAGAVDYVVKPLSMVPLVTRVRGALRLGLEARRRMALEASLRQAPAPSAHLADPVTGRPGADALAAVLAARKGPGRLLRGEIDGWINLTLMLDGKADAVKTRVLDLLGGMAGRLGDLLFSLPDGGFALVTGLGDASAAGGLAESMRETILAADIPHPRSSGWPCITVSIGHAALGRDADRNAARALDRAKVDGGNRVAAGDETDRGNGPDDGNI